jgi:hypothetical protein
MEAVGGQVMWAGEPGGADWWDTTHHGAVQHGVRQRLTGGPRSRFKIFQKVSNPIQTHSNLIPFKNDLPEITTFEIKYGCEGFDPRNNFTYRNFLSFEMDFE